MKIKMYDNNTKQPSILISDISSHRWDPVSGHRPLFIITIFFLHNSIYYKENIRQFLHHHVHIVHRSGYVYPGASVAFRFSNIGRIYVENRQHMEWMSVMSNSFERKFGNKEWFESEVTRRSLPIHK